VKVESLAHDRINTERTHQLLDLEWVVIAMLNYHIEQTAEVLGSGCHIEGCSVSDNMLLKACYEFCGRLDSSMS